MTKLKRWKGTSTDTQNTEFHYTCCQSECGYDYDKMKKVFETIYICGEFPELRAHTLNELKILVGNK